MNSTRAQPITDRAGTDLAPLFRPLKLGALSLPNRFVMSPMTRQHSPDGVPGENVAGYYRRRAEAGVGLIVTEGIGVDQPAAIGAGSMGEDNIPLLHGDAALAGWRRVTDDVHAAGGLIVPQLWHMGVIRIPGTGPVPDAPSLRPSGIWGPRDKAMMPPPYLEAMAEPTAPMSEEDIADVIAGFARSAANAKAVGFDGIAIHGAHGYLLDSFLWAATNHRADRWGGDIAGRTRLAAEVIRAIRQALGPELPIFYRWSQWKLHDYDAANATSPEEMEAHLAPLAEAGVDCFDISTRVFSKPGFPGSNLTLAGWAKKLTGKTVMAVGGVGLSKDLQTSFGGGTVAIDNLGEVASRVEAGEFDLIAVGRSLLVDPRWVEKARAGEPFEPFSLAAYGGLS
ncbi:NADH:flavin oxidoreductase [Sphingomonas sp. CGMCC 1.13654]|uniref:NADH:flavin oxidoreductase n=1 Tax=Sphingomonas chungangi TaxID=2683589 RepID=A0A838L332_9SPHN|nr:NADH:flavin oxidoreductase [Sphingomonas chungangi]MBA2933594.1 NADH:flavin oxidoreductase [Sphingomonas chungangi]MVW54927.1 12-oxophytodienoate reductase [Sphingomonas chungangi]